MRSTAILAVSRAGCPCYGLRYDCGAQSKLSAPTRGSFLAALPAANSPDHCHSTYF